MKVKLYGKVIERTHHRVSKRDGTGYDLYSIIIEEPGQYPSSFKLSTKDVSLFGQPDGPYGVGKMVTADAFANGRKVTIYKDKVTGLDTALKVPRYEVYFNLTALTSAELPASPAPSAASDDADDMPY